MMKKFRKMFLPLLICLLLAVTVFAACGPEEETPPAETDTFASGSVATAKVTGSYTTPLRIQYTNYRPSASYYTATVAYQMLTTYEDGTYCFVDVTVNPSAVDITWSATDAGAKCNPRLTRYKSFYGEYTSAAVDGDSNSLDITLTKPFRIIDGNVDGSGNNLYAVDTANWVGEKPLNLAATGETPDYNLKTAEAFLLENAWNTMTARVSLSGSSFERATLTVADAEDRTIQNAPAAPSGVVAGPAFVKTTAAYMSATDKEMGFVKYSAESYRVGFQFQLLLLYADGTYNFMQSSALFYNLHLAAQGTALTTNDKETGVEYTQYYGNYTAADNAYENTLLDITLKKPLKVAKTRTVGSSVAGNGSASATAVSGFYADTLNWTTAMTSATGKDAAAYLEQESFATSVVYAIKENTVKAPSSAISFLKKDSSTGRMDPVR